MLDVSETRFAWGKGCRPMLKKRRESTVGTEVLRDAASLLWMLLAASLPLFFGGASPQGGVWFDSVGCIAVAFWLLGGWLGRILLDVPKLLVWSCLLLILIGWCAALNPSFVFTGPFSGFESVEGGVTWLPSTVDAVSSVKAMLRWTLAILLLWMGVDLCRSERMRSRVRLSFLLGGVSVLLVAFGQRLSDAASVMGTGLGWRQPFFGTFIYPGSAGAYLNLLFPAFCLELLEKGWRRRLGVIGLFGTFLAWVWNTSRLSSVVGILELAAVIGVFLFCRRAQSGFRQRGTWSFSLGREVLLSGLGLLVLLWFVFPVLPLVEKWRMLPEQWHRTYSRIETIRACWEMAKDAGGWGMGPGTFGAAYPYYAVGTGDLTQGAWKHAHCDYLELWIEWGLAGCACWAVVVLGGAWRFAKESFWVPRCSSTGSMQGVGAMMGLCALCALALHAVADFPVHNPSVLLTALFWLSCAWAGAESKRAVGTIESFPSGGQFSRKRPEAFVIQPPPGHVRDQRLRAPQV